VFTDKRLKRFRKYAEGVYEKRFKRCRKYAEGVYEL
jgi:hypothetical protein